MAGTRHLSAMRDALALLLMVTLLYACVPVRVAGSMGEMGDSLNAFNLNVGAELEDLMVMEEMAALGAEAGDEVAAHGGEADAFDDSHFDEDEEEMFAFDEELAKHAHCDISKEEEEYKDACYDGILIRHCDEYCLAKYTVFHAKLTSEACIDRDFLAEAEHMAYHHQHHADFMHRAFEAHVHRHCKHHAHRLAKHPRPPMKAPEPERVVKFGRRSNMDDPSDYVWPEFAHADEYEPVPEPEEEMLWGLPMSMHAKIAEHKKEEEARAERQRKRAEEERLHHAKNHAIHN